ncbi:MAG: sensor histidine kinase [Pseudonocardiaceae bacterium]
MPGSRGWTVRARLAAVYGVSVLLSGIILHTVVYLLVRQRLPARLGQTLTPGAPRDIAQRSADTALHELLLWSAVSLAVLAVLSVAVGWWVAGRALRPLRRISATAQRLSSDNLHERIRLDGPRDELTDLAATFDRMLDRLQIAFDSQRRFVANASHELRTPLAIQRAVIQVELDDGQLGSSQGPALAGVRQKLLDANRRSERLIDGLLLLARSDRGLEQRQPVRLDEIVREVLGRQTAGAAQRHLDVQLATSPSVVLGDAVLLTQMVANLISNAIRHNIDHGSIWVRVGPAHVVVSNTGAVLDADRLPGLFEPFRRGAERTRGAEGSGLGLSIVQSIAQAHDGQIEARARNGGGLDVSIHFPAATG